MQLDSIKGIAITLAFLVPGYVWSATLSYFIPRRTKDAALSLLEFFTFSCVNDIFWLLLCLAIPPLAGLASHPIWAALVAFIAFFVTPLWLRLAAWPFQSSSKSRIRSQNIWMETCAVDPNCLGLLVRAGKTGFPFGDHDGWFKGPRLFRIGILRRRWDR